MRAKFLETMIPRLMTGLLLEPMLAVGLILLLHGSSALLEAMLVEYLAGRRERVSQGSFEKTVDRLMSIFRMRMD